MSASLPFAHFLLYALQLTVSVRLCQFPHSLLTLRLFLSWGKTLSLQRLFTFCHSFIMRCVCRGGNWMMLSFVHLANVSLNQYQPLNPTYPFCCLLPARNLAVSFKYFSSRQNCCISLDVYVIFQNVFLSFSLSPCLSLSLSLCICIFLSDLAYLTSFIHPLLSTRSCSILICVYLNS